MFYLQTDGQTERANQVLERYLRCFVTECQDHWVNLLNKAEFVYNSHPNASTKMIPFEALMGYSPEFRLRIEDNPTKVGVPSISERLEKLNTL